MGKIRRIYLAVAAFALATQSMSMFVSHTAHASSTIVSPDVMQNWRITHDAGSSLGFVVGPASTGQGSSRFESTDGGKKASLYTMVHSSIPLADITILSYDSYRVAGIDDNALTLRLRVDKDVTDANESDQGELVYMPQQSVVDQWQKQDARTGQWWFSNPANFDGNCTYAVPCTLDKITGLYEKIGVASGGDIGFELDAKAAFVGMIDTLIINDMLYDFEAIAAPQLRTPATDSSIQSDSFIASWDAVPTASAYVFESYTDAAATQVRTHEVTADIQKTEAGLTDGTSIWWRVKAIDEQGNAGNWSDVWLVTIDTPDTTEVVYPGVVNGDDDPTQELLTHMARLNEPFEIPSSLGSNTSPEILNPAMTATDTNTLTKEPEEPLATDKGISTVAAIPTEGGWKLFGVMWYWWVGVAVSCLLVVKLSVAAWQRFGAQRDAYVARGYPYDQYES